MLDEETLAGFNCPKCGGPIPIPEGQMIVICPSCDRRSIILGEHGLRRTSVDARISLEYASRALKGFLMGNSAIASSASEEAKLGDCLLVFMPFWQVHANVMGWVFGRIKTTGVEGRTIYAPREYCESGPMEINQVAANIGALGVTKLTLNNVKQVPFDYEAIHKQGMVFEPVGSQSEALENARNYFLNQMKEKSCMSRFSQEFLRTSREKLALVYYPLWVMRYSFKERDFQVVVDGYSGFVLYGKAPGNILHRAFSIVLSAALGTILMVNIPLILLWIGLSEYFSPESFLALLSAVAASFMTGTKMISSGYKKFRFGEHYEFLRGVQYK